MSDLGQYISNYQTQWCRKILENQEPRIQKEKKRPWIPPGELWEREPLAEIRAGTEV